MLTSSSSGDPNEYAGSVQEGSGYLTASPRPVDRTALLAAVRTFIPDALYLDVQYAGPFWTEGNAHTIHGPVFFSIRNADCLPR